MSRAPSITVNGERRPFKGQSLRALIAEMGIGPERRGVAVAINDQVVPRAGWDGTVPEPGDVVEIVQPMAGG
ncbi:MAG: sulfur carrier protein ThiS [Kiloniellales bacterium]